MDNGLQKGGRTMVFLCFVILSYLPIGSSIISDSIYCLQKALLTTFLMAENHAYGSDEESREGA